jgi:hypothetical protein
MSHAEGLRHVEAIETILNSRTTAAGTAGTTGSTTAAGATVTLDKAQTEQIRMHLAELKKLLGGK